MDKEKCDVSIDSLPDEIISIILSKCECGDMFNFGFTCKRYYNILTTDQTLFRSKLKEMLPEDVYTNMESHCSGDWIEEFKSYFALKKYVFTELVAMSPKFYLRVNECSLEDIRHYFAFAMETERSFFHMVNILQEIVKKASKHVGPDPPKKPYTLTELHYARIVLKHLLHSYLAVKWITMLVQNQLPPEKVLPIFLQWVDNTKMYKDEEFDEKLNEIAEKVKLLLKLQGPNDKRNEMEILSAVSSLLYHQMRMGITPSVTIETLDVPKVIQNKCGNPISLATIYQGVARRLGVHCELVVFSNHFFLEWRNPSGRGPRHFTVDLSSGALQPKRSCPFAPAAVQPTYRYHADALLRYTLAGFQENMGMLQNEKSRNAKLLLDFLEPNYDARYHNPYENFLECLLSFVQKNQDPIPVDYKYLHTPYRAIIDTLVNLNPGPEPTLREMSVNRRPSSVKFAVGMICTHTQYEYTCVVRSWQRACRDVWRGRVEAAQFGLDQPFYDVVANDQSLRYVAQEYLAAVERPSRLYHLEDEIARDFTHFDGWMYAPNDEKLAEFPDELPISEFYRNRAMPPP